MKRVITLIITVMVSLSASRSFAQDAAMYRRYADKGDKEAMHNLARCYWNGNGGVEQDAQAAFYWYSKAANKNYQPAQFMTAFCYLKGIGTSADWNSALSIAWKAAKKDFFPAYWIIAQVYKDHLNNPSLYVLNLTTAARYGFHQAQSELGLLTINGSEEYGVKKDVSKGFEWIKQAAENNDPDGLYYLGICYEKGVGVTADTDMAYKYYMDAGNAGQVDAQAYVGYIALTTAESQADYNTAYEWLKLAAEQGSVFAYSKIGDMYYYGLGVQENNNTAIDMYKYAANEGDAYSMCQLAAMYGKGEGASVDYNMMYQYYKQAADLNYEAGMAGLGFCYMNGYGVNKDINSGFQWYKKAADLENAFAAYNLACYYLEGQGTQKNVSKFVEYMEKAANLGYIDAKSALGYEYYSGENVVKDLAKSLRYFHSAADDGDCYSQAVLGYSYYRGEGVTVAKDYDQAFPNLLKAVSNPGFDSAVEDSGKADIYRCLAACYRYGRGCTADQSLAAYYTEQAAKYGDADSQKVSGILGRNNPDSESHQAPGIQNTLRPASNGSAQSSEAITVRVPQNQIETKDHLWTALIVELRGDCTLIYKRVTPKSKDTYVYSSKVEFIEDAETGNKYYLKDSTIGVDTEGKVIFDGAVKDFTETYPALPATVRYLNISSGTQYYVKNLKIR